MSEAPNSRSLDQARERTRKLRDTAEGEARQELDAIVRLLDEAAQRGEADDAALQVWLERFS